MKIEINTDFKSPSELRLAVKFLTELADLHQEQLEKAAASAVSYAAGVLGGAASNQQAVTATNTVVKSRKGKKDEPVTDTGNGGAAGAASSTPVADSAASANGDPAALTPEQEKAIERGDTVALSQAQVTKIVSDAEKAIDPAKLRTEIRSVLTPLMTSDKAIKVQELIAQFGGSVSKCADENLPALLVKAKELA